MIPIHNIYYMLTYAFSTLNDSGYRDVGTESFDNVYDLYSSILIKGISVSVLTMLLYKRIVRPLFGK